MNSSKFSFKVIDYVCDPLQNYKKYKDVKVEKDIVYHESHERCKFDVYYKESDKPLPLLINIHGGGYVAGGKRFRRSISARYADGGWFVVNMNYRLGPEYNFPAPVEDMINCLNHIDTIKEKYNIDTSKVVITGDSAGAYNCACLLASIHDEELRKTLELPLPKILPTALLGFCGPYNTHKVKDVKIFPSIVRSTLDSLTGFKHKKDYSNEEEYKFFKEASPIDYVNSNWPKTMLIYAKRDSFCKGQGESMKEVLEKHNVPTRVFDTTGYENHCFHLIFFTKSSKKCFIDVFDFLDEIRNS